MDRRSLFATTVLAGLAMVMGCTPVAPPIVAASYDVLKGKDGKPPTIMRQHWIMRSRGSPVDAEIPLTAAGEVLELRVLPEFTARPARYRVRLFRMSADDQAQSIAELGGLTPDFDNFVTFFVDGVRLKPGQYRLAIAGDADTDASDKASAFILKMQARPEVSDPSAKSR
jgi:hypothetical protein